jgi:CheY-like chemotaxis protein
MGAVAERARVLVVDDEPIVREVVARYLARAGYEVETAADGDAALAAFDAESPDLVLLDLMLPRRDGFEVFEGIRRRSRTPVIMLTARGDETDRVLGLELGPTTTWPNRSAPGSLWPRSEPFCVGPPHHPIRSLLSASWRSGGRAVRCSSAIERRSSRRRNSTCCT